MFLVTVPPAVHKRIASRAVLAAPVVVVSVTSASVLRVVVPAMAESNSEVMELFTVSPHVPLSSPVTGSAKPKSDVYAVVMFKTSSYDFFPVGSLCCFNSAPSRRL
jgi:hypothetical protein